MKKIVSMLHFHSTPTVYSRDFFPLPQYLSYCPPPSPFCRVSMCNRQLPTFVPYRITQLPTVLPTFSVRSHPTQWLDRIAQAKNIQKFNSAAKPNPSNPINMKHKAHKNRWIITDLSGPGAFFKKGSISDRLNFAKWGGRNNVMEG